RPGAVAAPTAGLHFSKGLLDQLTECGVIRANITLHVGAGTFKPVKSDRVDEHVMDFERFTVPVRTAELIRAARAGGRRVVAIGTTTVRALETAAIGTGSVEPSEGRTNLFVRHPFKFFAVDAILTNFHLPRSTLLMMICAFAGKELVFGAYREAVARKYRFYSYGDCMLII
ncbi:MAG: S-adenosylmethionine:tRNA ribosyltransferase-isomerase, partial [bacterium]